MYDKFSLKGYVSVITGASTGLGQAIAVAFAQAGSHLVISGRNMDGLHRTEELIKGEDVDVVCARCDITSYEDIQALHKRTMEHFGKVDVLVNNSGAFQDVPAEDMDFDTEWRRVMDTNVDGTFRMCQEFGREMIRQGHGNIINMASKSGIVVDYPNPQMAYNTSKAAIIMMTKSLAVEWGKYGIRVNCIAPGNIPTENGAATYAPGNPYSEAWIKNTPIGHFGKPEDMGAVAIYLASAASAFTTGAVELVDGGYSII